MQQIPATIALNLQPGLAPTSALDQRLDTLPIERMESGDCTVERCIASQLEVSEEHRRRFEAGDRDALGRLLETNIEFLQDAWVQNAIMNLGSFEARMRRGRGRPTGRTRANDWRMMMLFAHVNAIEKSGELPLSNIFEKLERQRIGLSATRIRDMYYEAKRAGSRRAFLFK